MSVPNIRSAPQPPQAAARVDIDALQKLYDAGTPGRWFTGIDSLSPDQEFMAVIHDAVPELLKELRELRAERNRRLAECVDSMPEDATLIKTTKLEALRSELAASQSRAHAFNDEIERLSKENRILREMMNGVLADLSMFCGEQDIKMIRGKIKAALAKP